MKSTKIYPALLMIAAAGFIASCKKSDSISLPKTATAASATNSSISATLDGSIALVSIDSSVTQKKDTLFLVNCFPPAKKPDTVAKSALPSAITSYLDTAYLGYTFKKAFKVPADGNNAGGYVVVVKYNNSFVGLKFDANGAFIAVVEQRMGMDKKDPRGAHPGGPFGGRMQGPMKDTIALSAVPNTVLTVFKTQYPTDTLIHAGITPDTTYILISKNNGLFVTAVKANGTIIKRLTVNPPAKPFKAVTASSLPAAISSYITTTYPGYVLDKAFELDKAGTVIGYDLLITANSSKYMVVFNSSGQLIKAITLH